VRSPPPRTRPALHRPGALTIHGRW
jgi:hypothetical protein